MVIGNPRSAVFPPIELFRQKAGFHIFLPALFTIGNPYREHASSLVGNQPLILIEQICAGLCVDALYRPAVDIADPVVPGKRDLFRQSARPSVIQQNPAGFRPGHEGKTHSTVLDVGSQRVRLLMRKMFCHRFPSLLPYKMSTLSIAHYQNNRKREMLFRTKFCIIRIMLALWRQVRYNRP